MTYSSTFAVAKSHDINETFLQGLEATSATAIDTLGKTVTSVDGREYKYVFFDSTGNDVKLAGHPCIYADSTTQWVVEGDISNAHTAPIKPGMGFAGVMCAPNADNNAQYMWVQTKGFCPGVRCGTGVAANNVLEVSTTELFEDTGSILSGTQAVNTAWSLGANTDATGGGASVCDAIIRPS